MKDEEGLKQVRQRWALGRTIDGLKPDPAGVPVSTTPFSDLASDVVG